MKKLIGIPVFLFFVGLSSATYAQSTVNKAEDKVENGAKTAGHEIKKGAKKVSHKTAEVAAKGKAKVTDEVYKEKVGPNGETVYIDNHSQYYWVDKKGHRHYVKEAQLKAKDQ